MAEDVVFWEYRRNAEYWHGEPEQLRIEPGDPAGRLAVSIWSDDAGGWASVDLPPEAVSSLVGALRVWLEDNRG